MGLLLDLRGQFESVHLRHHRVHQRQSDWLRRPSRTFHLCQRCPSAVDRYWYHSPMTERLLEDAPVGRVVVDHQHAKSFNIDGFYRKLGCNLGLTAEARSEVKGATLTHFALDPDPAA